MARTKGPAYKMKGSPMQRNFGIGSPIKAKPTQEEILAAANDSSHPNSKENLGDVAYAAWKRGLKIVPNKGLYHGAGGKIMNEDGTVNEIATRDNVEGLTI